MRDFILFNILHTNIIHSSVERICYHEIFYTLYNNRQKNGLVMFTTAKGVQPAAEVWSSESLTGCREEARGGNPELLPMKSQESYVYWPHL